MLRLIHHHREQQRPPQSRPLRIRSDGRNDAHLNRHAKRLHGERLAAEPAHSVRVPGVHIAATALQRLIGAVQQPAESLACRARSSGIHQTDEVGTERSGQLNDVGQRANRIAVEKDTARIEGDIDADGDENAGVQSGPDEEVPRCDYGLPLMGEGAQTAELEVEQSDGDLIGVFHRDVVVSGRRILWALTELGQRVELVIFMNSYLSKNEHAIGQIRTNDKTNYPISI